MRIDAAFPSKYLKAADLQGQMVEVTIQRVTIENIGDDEPKPVIYFQGKQKGLVLNKTNANTIAYAYGYETDDWVGAKIVLFDAMVDFQGRQVQAIRVRVNKAKPRPAEEAFAPPPAAAPANGTNGHHVVSRPVLEVSDEIPF